MPSYIKAIDVAGVKEWKDVRALDAEHAALREANPQYWDAAGNLRHDKLLGFTTNEASSAHLAAWLGSRLATFPAYEDMSLEQLAELRLRQGQFLTLEEVVAWIKEVNAGLAKKDGDFPARQVVRNGVLGFLTEQRI